MTDEASAYSQIENDPLLWLEQAEGARISAEVIWPHFVEAWSHHPSKAGIRENQLAFMHSFMLLTALAFESLIKGLAVAKGIDWRTLREDGGHGISAYVSRVTAVSDAELDLLRRLQEYLVWAGRYVIPMREPRYEDSSHRRRWTSRDPELVTALFGRLKDELHVATPPRFN